MSPLTLNEIRTSILRLEDDRIIEQSSVEQWAHNVHLTFVSNANDQDQNEGSDTNHPEEGNFINDHFG